MLIDSLKVIREGSPGLSVTGFESIAAAAQTERAATAQVLILLPFGIQPHTHWLTDIYSRRLHHKSWVAQIVEWPGSRQRY